MGVFVLRFTTTFILCFTLSACVSHPLDDFGSIFPGMSKSEVLATMGGPQATQRFLGKDRWTYRFYDRGIYFQKEVQFFEGNVIYAGDIYQPEVSAFEQDIINTKVNEELDRILEQEYRTPASLPSTPSSYRGLR